MDSVTQITLGAAVGEAVGGRRVGAKAPIWGAVLGTLPDLDTVADVFLTEAQALTFHRSLTHSLVFAGVVSLLVGIGLSRLHDETSFSRWQWTGLAAAVLFTHIGLDCLTTYGTQIFWPFSRYPVIFGTVFIIDPFYTVPLAAGLLISFRWPPATRQRRWANYIGLGFSTAYLLFTIGNKLLVEQAFHLTFEQKGQPVERIFTKPTPFNTFLWEGIAETEEGFYIGLYSLLGDQRPTGFRYEPKRHHLLGSALDHPVVQRLRRFSRGYFIVRRDDDGSLLLHDLRFGRSDVGLTQEGEYIFTFRLQRSPTGQITGLTQEEPELELRRSLLRRFLQRIRGRSEFARGPLSSASSRE